LKQKAQRENLLQKDGIRGFEQTLHRMIGQPRQHPPKAASVETRHAMSNKRTTRHSENSKVPNPKRSRRIKRRTSIGFNSSAS
jgi:hypothetical protein